MVHTIFPITARNSRFNILHIQLYLHKVTTETGVPTARMFPEKLKIIGQIEEKLRIS